MSEQQPSNSEGRQPGESGREYLARRAAEAAMHQEAVVSQAVNALHAMADAAAAERDEHLAVLHELPQQDETTLGPLWPGR